MNENVRKLDEAATARRLCLESPDLEGKLVSARHLARRGKWTIRQIAAIVGLAHSTVSQAVSTSPEAVGGRLAPDTLLDLLRVAVAVQNGSEVSTAALRRIIEGGTSATLAAKLTGVSESHIRRVTK